MKSEYHPGANVFEWMHPFERSLRFEASGAPLRLTIELRSKRWLGLRGRTVCSFTLELEQDCQSATFNTPANERGTPSSPQLSVTLTVAGLASAGQGSVQGIQTAPIVTISGPDDVENNVSGRTPSTPDPHVAGGMSDNRSIAPTYSLLNPAARGANDQLLSQALTESNDALRSQSSLEFRTPSIAESNPDAAGPAAEAAAQITWSGVSRISAVMKLVNVAADIHPLVKGVWSLLNLAYTLAKQQSDLDIKVGDLVNALDANCELARVLTEDQIVGVAKTIVTKILQEVLNGADVIKEYCIKRKSKLSVFRFAGSTTAIRVDACLQTLEVFRRDLADHVAANVHRDLHGLQTLALKLEVDLKAVKAKIDHIDDYVQTQEDKALLDQMPFAAEADRALRSRERGCLPNTRTEIIDAIVNWAIGAETDGSQPYIKGLHRDSRILWLCGVAGSGKSSIAISVARALRSMDRLAALYGFERALQTTLNPTNLFSTIARQRADRQPEQKRHLIQTLQRMKPEMRAITDAGEQFTHFVVAALSGNTSSLADVIVIDAFDESGLEAARRAALFALSPDPSNTSLPDNVRFIITSRYDPDVAKRLESVCVGDRPNVSVIQMEDIHHPHTERDITLYITFMLQYTDGLDAHRVAGDLARLAIAAEHSFQWASAACRFIADSSDHDASRLPADRLKETLATRGGLDTLYLSILDHHFASGINNPTPATQSLRYILGSLVCALQPLSLYMISSIASAQPSYKTVDLASFHLLARKLAAILFGTKDRSTPLVAFHTSFTDFLADAQRSKRYAVDAAEMHLHLAMGSLVIITQSLQFNICHLESSFLRNNQVVDLPERMGRYISNELSYACRFWPVHVQAALSSRSDKMTRLQESFSAFLENKLLLLKWLEVMSLTGTDAYESLTPLSAFQTEYRALSDLITFISYFAIPISTSVPHIYLSALAFTPSSSSVTSALANFPNLVQSSVPLVSWPQIRHTFAHQSEVHCVTFSSNGKWVLSGAESGEISVWDVYSGRVILPRMFGLSRVFSMAVSPDGSLLASGFQDGNIQLWDMRTMSASGEPLQEHTGEVNSVAFSPDGTLLASGSDDKTVRLWDVSSHSPVASPLLGHSNYVLSVAFSPSGDLLASSGGGTIRLWNVRTASAAGTPLEGRESIWPIVYSPNGTLLASGEGEGTVHLWDANTMSVLEPPLTAHISSVRSLSFSPDSKSLASCSDDRTIRLWDMTTRSQVGKPLVGHTGDVVSIAFSPDGALLASGSVDKTVCIWDAHVSPSNRQSPVTQFKIQNFAAFSRNGKLLASGSDNNGIQLWDVHSVSAVGEPLSGHTNSVRSVAFSPDGTLLASGSHDQTVRLWDVRTGLKVGEPLRGHSDAVWALAFSPDGKLLASGSDDGTIRFWDTHAPSASGDPLTGHSGYALSVAFSPDGFTLASGDAGGTVRLWDVQTRCLIGQVLGAHSDWVRCLVFSPDGMLLASGSDDKTVRIWDVTTHSAVGEPLKGHTGYVKSLAFSPDGALLESCSDDESVVWVWDVRMPSEVGAPVALLRHESNVYFTTFSLISPLLSSITKDGVAHTWNLGSLLSTQIVNNYTISEDLLYQNASSLLPGHPDLLRLSPECLLLLDDGWLVGPEQELVIWIPPAIRPSLSNVLEVERFGGPPLTRLDFTRFVCGSDWAKCYSAPPISSSDS